MELIQDSSGGNYHIFGYGQGYVQVNQDKLTDSFIISPNQLLSPWQVATANQLTESQLQCVLTINPQPALVLLGTGNTAVFLDPTLLNIFYQRQIGIEIMTTPAACRTYTVLTTEGRDVVCAIIVEC